MISKVAENQIVKWLFWGGIGVTILVTSSINYDPVNVSKLLLVSGIGFAVYFQLFSKGLKSLWVNQNASTIAALGFLIAGVWTLVNADNPKELAFFGTFGRNTGFLTYIALTGVFLGSLALSLRGSFKRIVWSLIIAGWINVAYCLSAALGFDPIAWNNIYNRILGTFGNPNFIGAFLGIYFVASIALLIGNEVSRNQKIALAIALPVAFWEILESKAIQGLALSIAGTGIVIFFALRGYVKNKLMHVGYLLIALLGGGLALAGALQKGPLSSYIYKTSVSLRGEYWHAGLNMGTQHLLTGVGWDGFGEWFRRARRPSALVMPGPETVTNAAHNVFIDIFAYGGLPLFLTYLTLVILSLIASLKVIKRTQGYDPIFVSLFAAWACYNLQAFISINQIGLAIWGWILGGTLIAFERATREQIPAQDSSSKVVNQGKSTKKSRSGDSLQLGGYLAGVAGFAIGLLIALPPFIADAQWRSALSSKDANKVMAISTRWPMDSYRLANNAILFANSQLPDQAHTLAVKGVEYNSGYFDAWKVLGGLSNASAEEKAKALEMMKKLDPLNTTLGK